MTTEFEMRIKGSPGLMPSDGFRFARNRARGVTVAGKSIDGLPTGGDGLLGRDGCSVEQKPVE